jgi:anti-sigma factor ChrR (cupin superfamily)
MYITMKPDNDECDAVHPLTLEALATALVPEVPPRELRERILWRVSRPHTLLTPSMADDKGWVHVIPGVAVRTLRYDAPNHIVTFLLRADAGASLPAHRHTSDEECVVLEGECTIGDKTLRVGDYQFARSGTVHPAATTASGVLVCMRGSTEDYPFVCP